MMPLFSSMGSPLASASMVANLPQTCVTKILHRYIILLLFLGLQTHPEIKFCHWGETIDEKI